jgi:Single Cache domain 2
LFEKERERKSLFHRIFLFFFFLNWVRHKAIGPPGDGKLLASPKAVPAGTDIRTLKDASGSDYGPAIYAAAQKPEGEITEVPSYLFPKPGTTSPTFPKISFVTKVGDLGCGVGYYK